MDLLDAITRLVEKALAFWVRNDTLGLVAAILGLVAVTMAIDAVTGRGVGRYFSRGVRTDAVYTFVYVSGLHGFLVSGPLFGLAHGAVTRYAPFLRLDLLHGVAPAVQFVVLVVVMDAAHYWVHRWFHASPVLWAFHSIHHSQVSLTPLTDFRFHSVDVLLRSGALFVPGLVLGAAPGPWTAAGLVLLWLEMLAHSDLGWGYGPLGRVLVSPGFHRVHHSAEPTSFTRNFGFIFSFWDRLFGTAAPSVRPAAYGAPGMWVPESFLRQIVFPFAYLVRRRLARPAGRPRPAPGM